MRLFKGLMTLAIILSLNFGAIAADNICFDQPTAGKIVVEIERSRLMGEAYKALEDSNVELQIQLKAYEDMLAAEQAKEGVYEDTIRTYDQALTAQRQACDQALREAKPSFVKQLINNLGFIGIGALLVLLL